MRRRTRSAALLLAAAAAAPVWASSEGAGGGAALLTPKFGTIFWTVITFVCLVILLGKVAWKPLLAAIATAILPGGVTGEDLAVLTDGWEALLVPDPLVADDLRAYARGRGALFVLGGRVLRLAPPMLVAAGEGWALADLASHVRSAETATIARALAAASLREALALRWPRALRALSAVLVLAERDLRQPGEPRGAPRRVLRMVRHRISGR